LIHKHQYGVIRTLRAAFIEELTLIFLRWSFNLLVLFACITLVACGGDSAQSAKQAPLLEQDNEWQAGIFKAQSRYKDQCATPRSGIDPFSEQLYPDRSGTTMDEKMWLRSWSNDTYLWYDEISDRDPLSYSVLEYFDLLKTDFRTDSGSFKDNFHFSQASDKYQTRTQSGRVSGYGISWQFNQSFVPRNLQVRYTEPQSPAAIAGVQRGDLLVKVNDIDFINSSEQASVDSINAALFPDSETQSVSFTLRNLQGTERTVQLTSNNITLTPVQNVKVIDTPTARLGYLQFNSHIRSAQEPLIGAVQYFVDENVTQLAVDLRYNGGGLLAIASQLAYMVAGGAQTSGLIFDELQFNGKNLNTNAVTGQALTPTPFYNRKIDYQNGIFTSQDLPSLNLTRIYVLTSEATCSASEAFINGLRGVDVEVVMIGDNTCGKPYGFYPQDNCGTTYFTIQFQGSNHKGFGDYSGGFIPTPSPFFAADVLGCPVADDFSHSLGDTKEAMLAAAINYMQDATCPAAPAAKFVATVLSEPGISIQKPNTVLDAIMLENALYTPIRE
jgi:carboxyl-terminal processing protease